MTDLLAVNNFGDTREGALMGPMGLLIIVLMAIATVLLIRNMNARLRRLPDRFPDQDRVQDSEPDEASPDDPRELDAESTAAPVEPSADERAKKTGS
jgi:hypothetical protein